MHGVGTRDGIGGPEAADVAAPPSTPPAPDAAATPLEAWTAALRGADGIPASFVGRAGRGFARRWTPEPRREGDHGCAEPRNRAWARAVARAMRRPLLRLAPDAEREAVVAVLAGNWEDGFPSRAQGEAVGRAFLAAEAARAATLGRLERADAQIASAAHERGLSRPDGKAPMEARLAWIEGRRGPAERWLAGDHAARLRRCLPGERGALDLATAIEDGAAGALDRLAGAARLLAGPVGTRARILFAAFPETRSRAEALAATAAAMDGARRSRACEAERARLAAQAERAAQAALRAADRPYRVDEVRAVLRATETEFRRWVLDGRIPILETVAFRKWGRDLTTTRHDRAAVDGLVGAVDGWRDADAQARHEARARPGDGEGPDAVARMARAQDAARDRFRRGLAKRAGLKLKEGRIVLAALRIDPDAGLGEGRRTLALEATAAWPDAVATPADPTGTPPAARKALAATLARETEALRLEAARGLDAAVAEAAGRAREGLDAEWARALGDHVAAELGRLLGHGGEVAGGGRAEGAAEPTPPAIAAAAFARGRESLDRRRAADALRTASGLSDYAALFPAARAAQRRLVLHVGPTNSGKTHAAMAAMAEAPSGAYLAPLRLMALEGYDRLAAAGLAAAIMTGEERLGADPATHVSCTIEMADLEGGVDVAVIDEVQMIADPSRGWAWTQAIVGMAATTVHMTGSADALPHVERVAAMTGEALEVVVHERLTPLAVMDAPARRILPGDAVIAFSRREVMRLREALGEEAVVATIYGALGPEVRRAEAERFRDGRAGVLVATDAVAMGLNLPIRRVLFSSLTKYDGRGERRLGASEIRQIAGRAGRHGLAEAGLVGLLGAELGGGEADASPIVDALAAAPAAPDDLRLPVMPPWRAVETVARELGSDDLAHVLAHVEAALLADDPVLRGVDLADAKTLAQAVAGSGLPLRERYGYLGCPVEARVPESIGRLAGWARLHGRGRPVPAPRCQEREATSHDALQECEDDAKALTAYLWLARRWPGAYGQEGAARLERDRVNAMIEAAMARRRLDRNCRRCGCRLRARHGFAVCDDCHGEGRTSRR